MQWISVLTSLGSAAVDEILYVETYPLPDTKIRVARRERRCGGLTATALVAAARLGARCNYAGRLGLDHNSHLVEENFALEQIDTSHAPRGVENGVVTSTIVVAISYWHAKYLLAHVWAHRGTRGCSVGVGDQKFTRSSCRSSWNTRRNPRLPYRARDRHSRGCGSGTG